MEKIISHIAKFLGAFYLKKIVRLLFIAVIIIGFTWLFWPKAPGEIEDFTQYEKAGEVVNKSLLSSASLPLTEEDDAYVVTDSLSQGIQIDFAGQESSEEKDSAQAFQIRFPKDYEKDPLAVKLDGERSIFIRDTGKESGGYVDTVFTRPKTQESASELLQGTSWWRNIFGNEDTSTAEYIGYTSKDERKTTYYAYAHDQARGEKILKQWTLYEHAKGEEKESYRFENAKLSINDSGQVEVSYYGEKEKQNKQAVADVDPSLLARAEATLKKETGRGLGEKNTPDFIIPEPYYIDKDGILHDLKWQLSTDEQEISVVFTPSTEEYPLAFDPTLSFTAPGQSNTGTVIGGETSSGLGYAFSSGDFNSDGRTDLAVGAYTYSSNAGRAYIFYNDGSIPTTAATADVIIDGETSSYFGSSFAAGDFNADGKTDLAVGAYVYSSNAGRAYIFYNDGSIPTTAATADVIITGEASSYFGGDLVTGDFNTDGKTDLAVGADGYSSNTGRAYIFYNDGSIPTTAATADVIITGNASGDRLGTAFATADFNSDGKADLAIGGSTYSSNTGRVYIFYNDGSIPTTAGTADITITGETSTNFFGQSLATGDFNFDGKLDLAVGASGYSSFAGRAYIFYNDGSIPTTAATADVIITGESSSRLGYALATADLNSDGRTDLAVAARGYSSNTGRVHVFYNDGSIPTTAATADVIITGESSGTYFGGALEVGDFNGDGKIDLVTGAEGYSSNAGRAYIFYSQNGQINTNKSIAGETSSTFGWALAPGDFNADGKIDLAVGAAAYSSNAGRAYIFYNDGSIPTDAASADVIITGESGSRFGYALTAGDFNADGKTDLAVGGWSVSSGRAYIFYNDGSIPTTAATADVIINGESSSDFGWHLTAGDFNADGKTDLAVGGYAYSSTGRAYIFYNDGSIPTTAATADVIITGESSSEFGKFLTAGDFNADGRTDLAVGGNTYSSNAGRAYIFYNDGSIPTTAATADVTITGESSSNFANYMAAGDFNADGRTDLAVGATGYSSSTGRTYIFHNDGSIPTTAATADVTITGEASSGFGKLSSVGDFNADGKTDLAVGGNSYSSNTGRVYIFYNDGSIPTTAATADVIITGEATGHFGWSLAAMDFNLDGKLDLIVGARSFSSSAGIVYVYETRDNYAWQLQLQELSYGKPRIQPNIFGQELYIAGGIDSGFGGAVVAGDFNADGKLDIAAGAPTDYSLGVDGMVYIFYNDGSIPSVTTGADVAIAAGAVNDYFGSALTAGDFNADGRTDLAVGADNQNSTDTGRVHIFYNDGSYPSTADTADVTITGESSSKFGAVLTSGDFNADGKSDLIATASEYSSATGRAYIFYNDGSIPTTAATADVTITGEASSGFGYALTAGDFNADGKIDFAAGGYAYGTVTGRVYIFYNDGSIPTTAASADVKITGTNILDYFGFTLTAGDFNADGRTDLAVGSYITLTGGAGAVYIFYNDGSIPTTAATADITITGVASGDYFGTTLGSGDFNADGRTDLVVGSPTVDTYRGNAFIFYNDGAYPSDSSSADVAMSGQTFSGFGTFYGAAFASGDFNADGRTDLIVGSYVKIYIYTSNDTVTTGDNMGDYFGFTLTAGDFNADGRTDLAVGAPYYPSASATGRAYIFYNDGSISTASASADVIIDGQASSAFGASLTAGDFNADGKTDLAVGAWQYSSSTGRAYIFYNDGSIPTTAASADVTITGGTSGDAFGWALTAGDFNADGKVDLAVNASDYASVTGRVYIFYNDGSIPTTAGTADVTITGNASGDYFGISLTAGDFNADGKTDLAVGSSYSNSPATSRVYIFHNDGSIPTTAATADVIITGDGNNDGFGSALSAGDFNFDGKADLAIGAPGYSSNKGAAYLFYNDGSIPTTIGTADVTITGEASDDGFGLTLLSADINADGRTDLTVGASNYPAASSIGRVYTFYNDGVYPEGASGADAITTGEDVSAFGYSLAAGDFNFDGMIDLVTGAPFYSSIGRIYTLISELYTYSTPPETTLKLDGAASFQGVFKLQ